MGFIIELNRSIYIYIYVYKQSFSFTGSCCFGAFRCFRVAFGAFESAVLAIVKSYYLLISQLESTLNCTCP